MLPPVKYQNDFPASLYRRGEEKCGYSAPGDGKRKLLVTKLKDSTVSRPEENINTPIYSVCSVAYFYYTVTGRFSSARTVFNLLKPSGNFTYNQV
jgi:hypothetical protein